MRFTNLQMFNYFPLFYWLFYLPVIKYYSQIYCGLKIMYNNKVNNKNNYRVHKCGYVLLKNLILACLYFPKVSFMAILTPLPAC